MIYGKKMFLLLLLYMSLTACSTSNLQQKSIYFKEKESMLEQAIKADDADAVRLAIKQGANPNAVGLHGVTPIIVSAGNLHFNAMKALIESAANPNIYDDNGDNAVTLAATSYLKGDKRYLEYLLDHGGNVNSKLPDRDPLFTRIALTHDLEAIRWLIKKGADINAVTRSASRPLIYSYALSIDWDTVWVLMEAGANYHFTNPRFSWEKRFRNPFVVPPGSPVFEYKEKVWKKLCKVGIEVPPLTTVEMWKKIGRFSKLPVSPEKMPIIRCDNKSHKVIGKWGNLKPKVVSALDALKKERLEIRGF